ncbi:hypothetical protein LWI29_009653 [Acer saccharum]|uniref:Uncharacterized protein n=1 Tax=Acer saccharum TaxID=4024 RepID=A0AA39T1B4_ACESA|nr:hypothetical protein LWI29_009653 [Acer saccharum]
MPDLGFCWVSGSHQTRSLTPDSSSTRVNAFRRIVAPNPRVLSLRSTPIVVDQHASIRALWIVWLCRRRALPSSDDVVAKAVANEPSSMMAKCDPRHGRKKEEGRRRKNPNPPNPHAEQPSELPESSLARVFSSACAVGFPQRSSSNRPCATSHALPLLSYRLLRPPALMSQRYRKHHLS